MSKKFNRRDFLDLTGKSIGLGALATIPVGLPAIPPPEETDDIWNIVRASYDIPDEIINMNNAGVSPHPIKVANAFFKRHRYANQAPSYYMWRKVDKQRTKVREELARMLGGKPEEIAITRNSTESLNTIIQGLPLSRKDEVVIGNYDYPHMRNAFRQREQTEGVVVKVAELQLPSQDKAAMVKAYTDQFTKKTKLVHITHLVNWCGQVVPVKEIAQAAHNMGIEVLVDAAQSFAHLDFDIKDWPIDYLGTSLHKWLGAPFGTGFLWIKEEHISKILVPFPGEKHDEGKITKFEHVGTRNNCAEMTILEAIEFHEEIGSARKAKRLFELKKYWTSQLKDEKSIHILTPDDPEFSGAIAVVKIDGKEGRDVARDLFKGYKVGTTVMDHLDIQGVRVSPNVYTLESDLDQLVKGLKEISKS